MGFFDRVFERHHNSFNVMPAHLIDAADEPIIWELAMWSRANKYQGKQTYYQFIDKQTSEKNPFKFDPETNNWKPAIYTAKLVDRGRCVRRNALWKWSKHERYDDHMTLFEYTKSHIDNGEIFDRRTGQWVTGVRDKNLDRDYNPFACGNGERKLPF